MQSVILSNERVRTKSNHFDFNRPTVARGASLRDMSYEDKRLLITPIGGRNKASTAGNQKNPKTSMRSSEEKLTPLQFINFNCSCSVIESNLEIINDEPCMQHKLRITKAYQLSTDKEPVKESFDVKLTLSTLKMFHE